MPRGKREAAGAAAAEAEAEVEHTALEPRCCADRRNAQPELPVKAAWLRGRARPHAEMRDWLAALLAPRAVARGEDVQRMASVQAVEHATVRANWRFVGNARVEDRRERCARPQLFPRIEDTLRMSGNHSPKPS